MLADGADGLKGIVRGGAERTPDSILDWFHIGMRLRSIEQMGPKTADMMTDPAIVTLLREKLPGLRHHMWHGQWKSALIRMRDIYQGVGRCLATLNGADSERATRFRQHLLELRNYLINNQTSLICHSQARQEGIRISSSPAESNMAHVINQRLGKRQPMRCHRKAHICCSKCAAHCWMASSRRCSESGTPNSEQSVPGESDA